MILAALLVKLLWIGAGSAVVIALGVFFRDQVLGAMDD